MQTVRSAAAHLKDLTPYDPRYLPARSYLNANENPYGTPQAVCEALQSALSNNEASLHRYPDPLAKRLRSTIAAQFGVTEGSVLLGNGGDELLFDLCLAYGGAGRSLLITPPTFSVYNTDAVLTHTEVLEIPRACGVSTSGEDSQLDFSVDEGAVLTYLSKHDVDIVVLTSPNNPTGDCLSVSFIEKVLAATDAVVLVDHAYIEFANPRYDATPLLAKNANLAILRTFSKAYGLAGMRIGYLVSNEEITQELCKVRQPYSVDTLAALAALAALEAGKEISGNLKSIISERERLADALGPRGLGLSVAPSEANYLLFRVPQAHEVWQQLYDEHSILLRDLSDLPGLSDCLRVSIGTPEENDELLAALAGML